MKIARNPQNIHPPVAPYVHQIEVTGPQRWLTLSGQIGMIADGSIPEDAIAQLKIALENIKRNLDSADMEVQDITKLVFYLVGDMDAIQRKEIISDFLGEHLPCTTLMYVVALATPALKVEIDAWACKDL
ncbi:RidA family protein [Lysinibacillus sp. OL1_EC]|uniref:RidA family protein n=1 Tax=unclassified Lysinibacillus TaxID=2636778 RepID=UPI0010405C05|nr:MULTISPECIES: RidA family protein [unclassified Lysinibacillus]MCM0624834.1 RidA family protein [Lysinibacillus sp. OL1_EC]MCS5502650.1 RidA family protein [Lysinibacillus sp. A4]TBV87753.1 RidA family protein [Lysinibacillus sp. OL1]UKJ45240.1 RidA family protein [Lysinibacillus sp. ACHW1.5]WGT40358.1 RidA family protein [Lysinibacillus sp. 1 U-2021]